MRDTSRPLKASDLRHTVTIEAPAGTAAEDVSEIANSIPAAIDVLPPQFQARESLGQGGLQTSTIYGVSVRYREDLLPSYVLVEECHTQRRFQILSITPSNRGDALDMQCVTNG